MACHRTAKRAAAPVTTTTRSSQRVPRLLVFLLCTLAFTASIDAQFVGGGGGSTGRMCPVDISKVRLDSGLADSCQPALPDLCVSCLCELAKLLFEAGYQVAGPDAVPFQACALANVAALQNVGLTFAMLFAASRCEEPACIKEFASPSPPNLGGGGTEGPANATAAETEEGPANATAAETEAVAAAAAGLLPAGTTAGLPSLVPQIDANAKKLSTRRRLTIAVAVPCVVAAVAAWAFLYWLLRKRQRKKLLAQHIASEAEDARGGVGRLDFDDITCVLKAPTGCAWRRRGQHHRLNDANPSSNPDSHVLLNHISGHASRGQMLALLGPSGAGKSTLLKAIAGRSDSSLDAASGLRFTSGSVTLDGTRQSPRTLSRAVAFVPQEDQLLPFLTVLETVMISAELRLPWFAPRCCHVDSVDLVFVYYRVLG